MVHLLDKLADSPGMMFKDITSPTSSVLIRDPHTLSVPDSTMKRLVTSTGDGLFEHVDGKFRWFEKFPPTISKDTHPVTGSDFPPCNVTDDAAKTSVLSVFIFDLADCRAGKYWKLTKSRPGYRCAWYIFSVSIFLINGECVSLRKNDALPYLASRFFPKKLEELMEDPTADVVKFTALNTKTDRFASLTLWTNPNEDTHHLKFFHKEF